MNISTVHIRIEPSNGPNTVAAPPSSRMVQTLNVRVRPRASAWTADGST